MDEPKEPTPEPTHAFPGSGDPGAVNPTAPEPTPSEPKIPDADGVATE
jgi:hypothetical protein